MTDEEIAKLASQLSKNLVSKEDLKNLASKEDLLNVEKRLEKKIERLDTKIDSVKQSLEEKLEELDDKADKILEFASAIDETVSDHEKRIKN